MTPIAIVLLLLILVTARAETAFSRLSSRPRPAPSVTVEPVVDKKESKDKVKVLVTAYWAGTSGSDQWTRRFKSASGKRLKNGVSVAVDPSLFAYGTIIYLEGIGYRTCVDTGRDVVKRVASKLRGHDLPVIDVFFEDRYDALRFARKFEQSHGNVTFAVRS